MTVISRSGLLLIGAVIAFIYATMNIVTKESLAAENRSQPHIIFSSSSYTLEKTKTDAKSDREGWTETAEWRSTQGESIVFISIFARVSYNKVFMRSYVQPPEKRIHDITGSSGVVLGAKSRIDTESGFYEYQVYSLNGIQCAYIQSYWGDKSFGGIDVVRGAKKSDTIVGNHMLQANFCDQNKEEMSSNDVTQILSSIDLRDAYWSGSWFADDSEVHEQKKDSTSISSLEKQPIGGARLSQTSFTGTYNSEITGRVRKYIKGENPKVELVQRGNTITGTYGDSEGEIWGKVDGNTIEFDWKSSINAGYGTGKWTFEPGASKVQGAWFTTALGSGEWSLFRQDSTTKESPYGNISGTYNSEIIYTKTSIKSQDLRWYFGERPKIQVQIEQLGDTIIGEIRGDRSGQIKGAVEGNKVTYEFEFQVPGGVVKFGNGIWMLKDDIDTLNGIWIIEHGAYSISGEWNLLKKEKIDTTSNTDLYKQPVSGNDVTGTYQSEISSNLRRFFKDTTIKVQLVQSGKKITGTFLTAKGDITGEIEDDTVRFSANPPYGNWTISGKWFFTTGYKEAAGDAGYHVTKGYWNLTRIE